MNDNQIAALVDGANQNDRAIITNIRANGSGLRYFEENFKCNNCGKCCDGSFYYVKGKVIALLEKDIREIAAYTHSRPRKIKKLTIQQENNFGFLYPCPFFNSNSKLKCGIYSVRPTKCKNYPLEDPVDIKVGTLTVNVITIDAECPVARKLAIQGIVALRDTGIIEGNT